MRSILSVHALDVHAEGQPGRVILDGERYVRGETFREKWEYAATELGWLRTLMLKEPRGYPGQAVNLIVHPSHPDADFGLIIMEQAGVKPMSGSNTICSTTAVLESGYIRAEGDEVDLTVETGAGLVRVHAELDNGKVTRVTFRNVPAFAFDLDTPLQVPEYGEVRADVVFGGQIYVQVRATDLGVDLVTENAQEVARAGIAVLAAAREQLPRVHPLNDRIRGPQLPMIYGDSTTPGMAGRDAVVIPIGTFSSADPSTWVGVMDRSPCGTGTSGRMAARVAKGEQQLDEPFYNESIIGSYFIGRALERTTVASHDAIVPSISGRGWVSGEATYLLDASDPWPEGFTVPDIWGPGDAETETR